MAGNNAEEIASSEESPQTDRSTQSRRTSAEEGKIENSLEMNKSNKVHVSDASEVAGRKGKGTGTGLLEKLTPGTSKD